MKLKRIKLLCFFSILLAIAPFHSFATWSIIVADPKTKEIGIAAASCVPDVYNIGVIVRGKGAVVVQAKSNASARRQAFIMIWEGETASAILEKIRQPDYLPEQQQYGIVCMNDIAHPAAYTGKENTAYAAAVTGYGISVQGNILADAAAVQAVFDAAVKAQKASLPIQDVLMLALEAGARLGGDKRCGDRKAASAFLTVSRFEDITEHWLDLVVHGDDGHTHAVEALREKFEEWKRRKK